MIIKYARYLIACISLTILSLGNVTFAELNQVLKVELYPTTGFNSDCDQPIFDLPDPLPNDLHFDFIGLYNPDAPEFGVERDALSLTMEDCTDSLNQFVASTSNLEFLAINGLPEPDSRLKNLRSHEIPKVIAPDGTRATVPLLLPNQGPFPTTNIRTAKPLTLGEFRDIKGNMTMRCESGRGQVKLKLQNYEPDELLTVWAIWLTTPPGAIQPVPVPMAFGGVPNTVVIDAKGDGLFERHFEYCPLDVQEDGSTLLMLDIASHLDSSVYGAMPDTPFSVMRVMEDPADPGSIYETPMSAGIVTVNRGAFPVSVMKR